jgi:hypothetical protein
VEATFQTHARNPQEGSQIVARGVPLNNDRHIGPIDANAFHIRRRRLRRTLTEDAFSLVARLNDISAVTLPA